MGRFIFESLSQLDLVSDLPQLILWTWPWIWSLQPSAALSTGPTMLDMLVMEHPIPAGRKARITPNGTLSSKAPRVRARLFIFLYYVSKMYFSAEEVGLVLYLCSCSSIETKAKGFQEKLVYTIISFLDFLSENLSGSRYDGTMCIIMNVPCRNLDDFVRVFWIFFDPWGTELFLFSRSGGTLRCINF